VIALVDCPDLNVWLALASPTHEHHHQAARYWEQQAAQQVVFCDVTAIGLVRLVSQAKVMGPEVKSPAEASQLLQAFCAQPGVAMGCPQTSGWDVFHAFLRQGDVPPRLCTDAYLASLAVANGWRLVSFDNDFGRFAGLNWLQLS